MAIQEVNVDIQGKVDTPKYKSLIELTEEVGGYTERIEECEEKVASMERDIVYTNDEDITVDNEKNLILADKQYDADDYSGLGRVYLRKNMIVVSLPFDGFLQTSPPIIQSSLDDTPDAIFFDVPGERFVGLKNYRYYINWQNNEGYRANLTDGDLFSYDNKYYEYNDGALVVKENPAKTNVLTQAMINKANTIYHIQYDYDLNGAEITIPDGCVLEFDGGSMRNGTLGGNNTVVKGIVKLDLTLTGNFIYYVPNNIQLIESGSTKPTNPTTGQRFFDTSLNLPIYWDSSRWLDCQGYTAAPHKGTTTQRNALVLDASTDIGFDFYDTTLGVKLYAGAIDSNGAVTRWLDEEGYTYHLKSGYERPTNLTIFDNYMSFYDLNLEMMIYAHISGSGSGTTIVWKDINGHTPLPKTATLNNSSAATYLGTTHADATSDDIGMEVWITDKNKVAYLGDVRAAGSIVQHKWYYADGSVALDESQAPTPSV